MMISPPKKGWYKNEIQIMNQQLQSYGINLKLLLFLQLFGLNAAAAQQLACMLELSNFKVKFGNFSKMEEAVALEEINLIKN